MLNELLTKERIRTAKKASDWKEAIRTAAKPLIEDGAITDEYVEAMIESVLVHGPYIVLAERFALPHASAKSGVNRLSMSLLQLEEDVDLQGEPVRVFIVLAAVDKTSHIEALGALSNLLCDESNLRLFINGSIDQILALINLTGER